MSKKPQKPYYVKRKPFFRMVKHILRQIKPRVTVIDQNAGQGPLEPGIFLSNHSAATGPLMIELYMPYDHHPWGAHQMNGRIRSRFNYLYRVFYRQKKHMKKVPAFLLASVACLFSKMLYRGMGLISTYPDIRLKETMDKSIAYIEKGTSVVIYPENSARGYHEIIGQFLGGFTQLAKMYYQKHGRDLPVYSMYFHQPTSTMVISTPENAGAMLRSGMTVEQVCAYFCKKTNDLHDEYIEPIKAQQKAIG